LVGNGMEFRPLDKIVHSDQQVSVSLVAPWERPCYIDGYLFERGPVIVLMSMAPIPCSWAATGYTGVTLLVPLLNIVSCLEPIVPLPDLIQGLVTSWWSTM
jgi:hypothetical protein